MTHILTKSWADIDTLTDNVEETGLIKSGNDVIVGNYMITADGGMAIKAINNTGATSVKGIILQASGTLFNGVEVQEFQFDSVGVMYSEGVADGEEVWVVQCGKAYILLEDSTASTSGNWVYSSTVDGRADATLTQPPGGTIVAIDNHFKEIGHCLETVTAGTNKLALCFIHFN